MSGWVAASRDTPDAIPAFSNNVVFTINRRTWLNDQLRIVGEISNLTLNHSAIDGKKLVKVATNLFMAENLFFGWHEKTQIFGLTWLLNDWIGLNPKDEHGVAYDLSDPGVFQTLAKRQCLPPEYELVAKRLQKQT